MRQKLASGIVLAAAAVASPALAQDAPQADVQSDDDSAAIIVTAQRRAEQTQNVPISITSITADTITQANVQEIGDVAKLSPATRFDYQGSFVQPTVRGVGTAVVSSGANSNVGIYIDGFYSPAPTANDFQLLNVESIQILKGPQGTLFGRNTTGGAILVTSAEPSTTTAGTVQGSYGSFNTARVDAYATTGLTDAIAFDAQGSFKRSDGYARNFSDTGPRHPGSLENWSVRTGLKIDLSDTASLLLRYTHQEMDDPTNQVTGTYRKNWVSFAPQQYDAPTGTLSPYPATVVPTGYRQVAATPGGLPEFRFNGDVVQLTGKFDLGFADLTTYTQYRNEKSRQDADQDQTLLPISYNQVPITDKTFTQEFLLTSAPGGPLQWTSGLFYYNFVDTFFPIRQGTDSGNLPQLAHTSSRTQSIAAYLDVTYQLSDHVYLTGGARYSHDVFDRGIFEVDYFGVPVVRADYDAYKADRVTPRAVLRYEFSSRSSAYASYTRGYKAGLVDVLSGGVVRPEVMDAFEVGYKYGSRKFSLDIAAWYYNYKDLQLSIYPAGLSQILNAATARIYGFEASTRYQITPDFEVNAAASYVNAKYRDFEDASRYLICDQATVTCSAGSEGYFVTTDPAETPYDASGGEMQRAPKFTFNAGARYGFDLGDGRAAISGTYYRTSSFYFDPAQQFRSKPYDLLGLRAEWTDPSDKLTLAVFADNVTGTRYYSQVITHQPGIGGVWGSPRTVTASVRYRL